VIRSSKAIKYSSASNCSVRVYRVSHDYSRPLNAFLNASWSMSPMNENTESFCERISARRRWMPGLAHPAPLLVTLQSKTSSRRRAAAPTRKRLLYLSWIYMAPKKRFPLPDQIQFGDVIQHGIRA